MGLPFPWSSDRANRCSGVGEKFREKFKRNVFYAPARQPQGEKDAPGEICLACIRSSPGEVSAFGLVSPRKELLPARRPEGGFAWNAVGFSPTSTTGPKAGHRGGTSPAGRGPRCRTTSGAAPACWPV